MWHTHNGDVGDGIVLQQPVFDIGGVEILSTDNHHVVETAHDVVIPFLVFPNEIASAEEATTVSRDEALRVRLGPLVVGPETRIRYPKFASVVGLHFVTCIRVDDSCVDVRERSACTPEFPSALSG